MTPAFTEEYRTVDKSTWGAGPWQQEPDKAVWVDEATGLDCMIVRGPVGALCGYVGVPESHPWHGRGYSESDHECDATCDEGYCPKRYEHSPEAMTDVHGGLTYAEACRPRDDPSTGICHLPKPDRPDKVWWFGFDCAHLGDFCPLMRSLGLGFGDGSYKDLDYVAAEVTQLARQLAAVSA